MDNYPLGADNKNAPWNQEETPKKEFNVFVSQILNKTTSVTTNDYIYRSGKDENGEFEENLDTSETDWHKAYEEEHFSLAQLIGELKTFLIKCEQSEHHQEDKATIQKLLQECEGWIEDDIVVVED